MSFKLSRLVFLALLLSVTLRLGLSSWLLNDYYPYSLEGGAWFQKIHPGSLLALLLFLLVLFFRNPIRFVREQSRHQFAAIQFLVVIVLTSLFIVIRFGFGGTAYLIDTFAVGAVYMLLAAYMSQNDKKRLANSIYFIVITNSIIAVLEYTMKHHFMAPDAVFRFFRASALFGHPLANALITATTAIVALRMQWPWILKVLAISVMLLSLFAFGGRGSMVTLLVGINVFLLVDGFMWKRRLKARLGAILAFYAGLCAVAGTFYYVVFKTEIGSPIASRIMMDSSIQARFGSLAVLSRLSLSQLLLGMDQAGYSRFLSQHADITPIIENFWVVLLLRLSLPIFIVFCASFLYLLFKTAKDGTWVDILIVLVFLAAASTNNSLSGKSPALAVYLLLVSCVREAGRSLPPTLRR